MLCHSVCLNTLNLTPICCFACCLLSCLRTHTTCLSTLALKDAYAVDTGYGLSPFLSTQANGVCCVRVGPLGSRLRLVNFMHHLHRRAAFFAGGLRDDCYLHFGSIIFEIGVRECCQLVNKSLRSDWDSYPHSFLLYHEGHIQVTDHAGTQYCVHGWLTSEFSKVAICSCAEIAPC